ncbi:MAG: PH domain-containing protein [Myxococcaceae bacterium]|nr:PH domain-containing protein [Myxococcaceae bacterium]
MGYVESNLMKDEQVVYRAKLHWVIFISVRSFLTLFVLPLIDGWTSEFAVTDRRVIIKVGLIARRTVELNLAKVESVIVDQGVIGRILGYGTIFVVGTGGTRERFEAIADPLGFRQAVTTATEALQAGGSISQGAATAHR